MLIGHQKQWQFLKKSVELGRISHALLFVGPAKLGKKTLAFEFIKWLFKDDVQKRQHPDFIFVEPEKKEIKISQIRDCIWKLSLKPFVAPFKAAIIDEAHCMNQEAQNCFLKTLEEPKGKTILILITEYPETLLPTIISRCEIIRFSSVEKTEIKKYLEKSEVFHKNEEMLNFCLGRPGLAVDFVHNQQKLESQQKIIRDLIKISDSSLAAKFRYAKELSEEPQQLGEILDIWTGYFRNILLSKIKGRGLGQNSSFNNYSLTKLKKNLQLLQRIVFLTSRTNVNLKLAIETLLLEL